MICVVRKHFVLSFQRATEIEPMTRAERVIHSPISAKGHTANRPESVRARTAVFLAYQASTVAHIPMMQPMFRLTFRVKVTHLPK